VVDADVAVVASIGFDHQEYLGTTLDAIAREKAGIFRPGRPAVLGSRDMPRIRSESGRFTITRLLRTQPAYANAGPPHIDRPGAAARTSQKTRRRSTHTCAVAGPFESLDLERRSYSGGAISPKSAARRSREDSMKAKLQIGKAILSDAV